MVKHIAECAQCGLQGAFVISLDELDIPDDFPELNGEMRVVLANSRVYVSLSVQVAVDAPKVTGIEKRTVTLRKIALQYLKSVEVALCPTCGDYCDVTENFSATMLDVEITEVSFR